MLFNGVGFHPAACPKRISISQIQCVARGLSAITPLEGKRAEEYHGVIVKEGIKDQSILNEMNVLGSKVGQKWTLLKVGVSANDLEGRVAIVMANLVADAGGVPYYAHFYGKGELIVVFPAKVFRVKPDRETWREAIAYGESLGILIRQLDFKPSRIEEETY